MGMYLKPPANAKNGYKILGVCKECLLKPLLMQGMSLKTLIKARDVSKISYLGRECIWKPLLIQGISQKPHIYAELYLNTPVMQGMSLKSPIISRDVSEQKLFIYGMSL